jgi:hypothetical protein
MPLVDLAAPGGNVSAAQNVTATRDKIERRASGRERGVVIRHSPFAIRHSPFGQLYLARDPHSKQLTVNVPYESLRRFQPAFP